MKTRTLNQRAEHAATCQRLKRGTVQWDWFCFGFKKGAVAVVRHWKKINARLP